MDLTLVSELLSAFLLVATSLSSFSIILEALKSQPSSWTRIEIIIYVLVVVQVLLQACALVTEILSDFVVIRLGVGCASLISWSNIWFIVHSSMSNNSRFRTLSWAYIVSFISCSIIIYQQYTRQDGDFLSLNIYVGTLVLSFTLIILDMANPVKDAALINENKVNGRFPCTEKTSSFLGYITFSWVNRLLTTGLERPLVEHDLPNLLDDDQMENIITKWEAYKSKDYSVLWNLLLFSRKYPTFQILASISDTVLDFSKPFFINRLLKHIEEKQSEEWSYGLLLLVGMFVCSILQTLIQSQIDLSGRHWGIQLRSIFIYEIFKKSLRRSNGGYSDDDGTKASQGRIVNLMSSDTNQIRSFITDIHEVLIEIPLSIIISIMGLLFLMGPPALAGLAVLILTGPLSTMALSRIHKIYKESRALIDARIQVTNEALQGIRIIKYMAWEPQFLEKISSARESELKCRLKLLFANILINSISWGSSILVTFTSFFVYTVIAGKELDAATAFTSISLLDTVSYALSEVSELVSEVINVKVTLGRINDFLNEEELEKFQLDFEENKNIVVGFSNGEFTYFASEEEIDVEEEEDDETTPLIRNNVQSNPSNSHSFFLRDLSIEFPVGKLTSIIGPTGSGKSSLLMALLGEMKTIKGKYFIPENHLLPGIKCKSEVAYVSQTAWLMNATIRDNILFGEPYEETRYNHVISACSLRRDLENFDGGDLTEIGEKGVNLSGGQKQRVSLARAAYSKAPIVLLDDPLSAVDAPTARYLLTQCILGLFKGRTVLLVTHAVSLVVPASDLTVVMDNGSIKASGTTAELIKNPTVNMILSADVENTGDISQEIQVYEANDKKGSNITEVETKSSGSVKFSTYITYITACGGFLFTAAILLTFSFQVLSEYLSNWWIGVWTDSMHRFRILDDFQSSGLALYYISIYGLIGIIELAAINIRFVIQFFGGINASRKLHSKLVKAVLGSPLRFFEVTPVGRIINRFSKDIGDIDTTVLFTTIRFFIVVYGAFIRIIIVGSVTPTFFLCLLLFYFYYKISIIYLTSSREIKRIESVSASPIYALFGETLIGVSTIRAYGAEHQIAKQMESKVDANHRAWFYLFATNRWLSVRTSILSGLIVFGAGASVIASGLSAGWAGVAFIFANTITKMFSHLIQLHSSLEMAMNAVERVEQYTMLEQEPPMVILDNRPPNNWPQAGSVKVENLAIKYAPDLPVVLKNLTFDIKPREKIGVVGRTGAGKSTLSMAFFRILPFESGSIEIDGIDISSIGLSDLRSKLTIIPQDPILFKGTLRSNLDPTGEHEDAQIWDAISQTGLLNSFQTNRNQQQSISLDYVVNENGSNFSQGQRQLLCLARALLRSSKFIFMDEATASVDYATDGIIQNTIRTQFKEGSVLTVAHRLKTVIDYDRILVLDNGEIIEYDKPSVLLEKKGLFYRMCAESGELEELIKEANKH